MPDESRLAQLMVKLVCQDLTGREGLELDSWRGASTQNEAYLQMVTSDASIIDDLKLFMGMNKASLVQKIDAGIRENEPLSKPHPLSVPEQRPTIRRLKFYLSGAAAAVLVCLILIYLLKTPGKQSLTAITHTGGSIDSFFSRKALDGGSVKLTLADGIILNLDSLEEGVVVRQAGMQVHIADDSRTLLYTPEETGQAYPYPDIPVKKTSPVVYNVVTVPYGNRYQLQLSDGTKVKLNVGSSIRYPVAFTGDKKVVEVTGEVFFDVVHDSRRPFIVKAHKEEVEVVGTGFVVSDYPSDKRAKVAVATGAVVVRSGSNLTTVHPSQGADIGESGDIRIDPNMDIARVLSLKEDYFNFDGLDIKAALWQLAQSYHMRILFDDNIKSGTLGSGNIQRDLPLNRLLKDLELPDLHFEVRMQDNTIVVTR